MAQLKAEAGADGYACKMLDRKGVQNLIPKLSLGTGIASGSYSPHDGHLNPLYLLHGLYKGFYNAGGRDLAPLPAYHIVNWISGGRAPDVMAAFSK